MTDVTQSLNACLASQNSRPVAPIHYSLDKLDEFLKEAYNINARIGELTTSLRTARTAYLSTTRSKHRTARQWTDADRTSLDASAKSVLSQLLCAVSRLEQVETLRHETALNISLSKRAKTGVFRWAAGGAITAPSGDEARVDAAEKTLAAHREAVVGYLKHRLGETSRYQLAMMEIRLRRDEERSKSVLSKAVAEEQDRAGPVAGSTAAAAAAAAAAPATTSNTTELSSEQLQLFAQENQNLIRSFEHQRDQLRATQKSLEEIAELQSALASNLDTQHAHIEQLVQDSFFTADNVGRGNKELKKASERTSTAMILFHGTCAFCLFLVVWDLAF